jgi:hypothetical protein
MKTLLTIGLIVLLNVGIQAQNEANKTYLLLEFMQVKGEQSSEYLKVEDFWSGIHKQRLADKSILGWDLWSLTPAGKEQGSQYLTVTLFPSLQSMLQAIGSLDVVAYAKKAYPAKTEKELTSWMEKTVKSRDIAHQVLFRLIDNTKDEFKMKPGTIFTIDIMKQLDDNYEKVESEVFKPWHQQMVNEGKKGSWKLLQTILPSGSEAYGTHLTVSMYQDEAQLASFMESSGGEMDFKTQLAVRQGLKSRDLRETKFGKLLMTVH